jgi:hypothetical protein
METQTFEKHSRILRKYFKSGKSAAFQDCAILAEAR